MERIKELMSRYNEAQRAGQEAAQLRKQLVPLLKEAGLTKTKFNFGDRIIRYYGYNSHEGLSQQLIKSVIREKYPNINPDKFVADLCAARKVKPMETLKVTNA